MRFALKTILLIVVTLVSTAQQAGAVTLKTSYDTATQTLTATITSTDEWYDDVEIQCTKDDVVGNFSTTTANWSVQNIIPIDGKRFVWLKRDPKIKGTEVVKVKCTGSGNRGGKGHRHTTLDGNELSGSDGASFLSWEVTKVEFVNFDATWHKGYIEIQWQTATEIDNAGYHLYRSMIESGEKSRLTEELIIAQGDELQGASYSLKDSDVAKGVTYYYWLEDVDLSGNGTMHGPVLASKNDAKTPTVFSLAQNYPNPFNPTVEIRYDLREDSRVRLEVYNVRGQLVATLVDDFQEAGTKVACWNGKNERGLDVSAGVYFYRLKAGDFVDIKKMVLSK